MTQETFNMEATAIVKNDFGEVEIKPDAKRFDTPVEALEAALAWAKEGFWPAARPISKLTIEIEVAHDTTN